MPLKKLNPIHQKKTGEGIRKVVTSDILLGALDQQNIENATQLNEGKISQGTFNNRKKAIETLRLGVRGGNGGSVPFEYFKDAGLSQEKLDALGIKDGGTTPANGQDRMFQVSHIDRKSMVSAQESLMQGMIDDTFVKEQQEQTETQKTAKEKAQKPSKSAPKSTTETKEYGWNDLAQAQEGKKVDEFIGAGAGIIENKGIKNDIYTQNAQYGELSKAQSTDAKIRTQGGIDKAVDLDIKDSALRASGQAGAVPAQIASHAKELGISKEKINEAFASGGNVASKLIALGISSSVAQLASAQVGAKTGSDLKEIQAHGGAEQYIHNKESSAISKGTSEATQTGMIEDPKKTKAALDTFLQGLRGPERARVHQNMIDNGMLREDSKVDDIKPTGGHEARAAWAKAASGAMNRDMGVMIGGHRVTFSQDPTSNQVKLIDDNSSTKRDGNFYDSGAAFTVMKGVMTALHGGEAPEDGEVYEALRHQQIGKFGSKNWASTAFGAGSSFNNELLDMMGAEKTPENQAIAAVTLGGVATTAAVGTVVDVSTLFSKNLNGSRILKKDFTYEDQKGNTHTLKAGSEVNIKHGTATGSDGKKNVPVPGLKEHYEKNHGDFRFVRSGPVARGVGTVIGGVGKTVKSASDKFRGVFDETPADPNDDSGNGGSNNNNNDGSNDPHEEPKNNREKTHNKPPLKDNNSNYTTEEGIKAEKEKLNKANPETLGKNHIENQALEKKVEAEAELKSAQASKDFEKINPAEKKLAAANKVLQGVKDGEVDTHTLQKADIEASHTKTIPGENGQPAKTVVDFEKTGEAERKKWNQKFDDMIDDLPKGGSGSGTEDNKGEDSKPKNIKKPVLDPKHQNTSPLIESKVNSDKSAKEVRNKVNSMPDLDYY